MSEDKALMKQKSIIDHAKFELERAGLLAHPDPAARKVANDVLALVKHFVKQRHSAQDAPYALEYFEIICNFLPLTPITNDPDEWEKFEITRENKETGKKATDSMWQNRRAPSVMSHDGGKTYMDESTGKPGESVDYKAWVTERDARLADYVKKMEDAKKPKKNPVGHVQPPADTSAPAGEETAGGVANESMQEGATTPEPKTDKENK